MKTMKRSALDRKVVALRRRYNRLSDAAFAALDAAELIAKKHGAEIAPVKVGRIVRCCAPGSNFGRRMEVTKVWAKATIKGLIWYVEGVLVKKNGEPTVGQREVRFNEWHWRDAPAVFKSVA